MIHFRILGAVELRSDDGRDYRSVLAQPKRVALLAQLAVVSSRGFERRDTLLGLFWPELDEEHARGALNSALYHLRRSLGSDVISSRGEELRLSTQHIAWDTDAFERAARSGDLETALQLYRGDLLEGWFVDDSPEFEQWLAAERLRLRQIALRCARELADRTVARNPAEALAWARRAHTLAPDDETVLRSLLSCLDAAGDKAGALRAFQEFAQRAEHEFGIAPAAETIRLVNRIRARAAEAETTVSRAIPVAAGQRTTSSGRPVWRKRLLVAVTLMVIVAAIALRPHAAGKRVLIATFENRTGKTSLDPIGEMSADWIAQGIERAGVAEVVDRTASANGVQAGANVDWLGLATRMHARLLLLGSYYLQEGRLQMRARLYDVEAARITEVFDPITVAPDSALKAIQLLQNRAASAVSIAFNTPFAADVRGASPPTYDAYLEYLAGVESEHRRDYEPALSHLLRAGAIDSTFTQPALNAALAATITGQLKVGDSLLATIARRTDQLTQAQRLSYEFLLSARQGDMEGEARAVRKLARYDPDSEWPYMLALRELYASHPHRAASILANMNPRSPALDGLYMYWVLRAMALHASGNHRAELRVADQGLKQYPNNTAVWSARLRALAALGKTRQVLHDLADLPIPEWGPGTWNPGEAAAIAASELDAHGHPEAAQAARAEVRAWYAALPPRRTGMEAGWFGVSWTLYTAEAWPELNARTLELQRSGPVPFTTANFASQRFAALVAARRGDTLTARKFDRSFAALSREELLGSGAPYSRDVVRAEIAAFLGDNGSALALLRQAAANGVDYDIYFHTDPAFARLRSTPAFRALLLPKD